MASHTSRHTGKNSGFSTQDEHWVLLGLEALTDTSNFRSATRSSYHFYIEEGLPKARVLLWIYGEQLRALCEDVILAEYHCNYEGQTRKVAAIHQGVFYPTRFASPHGTLVPLN